MYLRHTLLVLAVVTASSISHAARACSFIGGVEPPCSAYWKADAVFAGSVVNITDAAPEPGGSFKKLLLHFTVEQNYKGVEGAGAEVATVTGTSCDVKFERGERWLVYANRNATTGKLEVSFRTTRLVGAGEDLSYLRSLSEKKAEPSVVGGVYKMSSTPWEGVTIVVEGGGRQYRATTDKGGRFKVPRVKPGRYTIRGTFPPGTGVSGFREPSKVELTEEQTVVEYQEEVSAGRCGYVEFFLIPE